MITMSSINSNFSKPISELIKERYSCRTYSGESLTIEIQEQLANFINILTKGPFGSRPRFDLVASKKGDPDKLSDLGTYGFIKDAPGYIIGLTEPGGMNLEDFGFLMEAIILFATDLGLGTCWLGGTFTRSTFTDRVNATKTDLIPAVTAVGYPAKKPRKLDGQIRQTAGSDHRLPWEELFFNKTKSIPLTPNQANEYAEPLEMVRQGPSASNKQPWRIIKGDHCWHFYLCRTPGYRDRIYSKIIKIEDLQRVDMGIAMCHFELTAKASGLSGSWQSQGASPFDLDSDLEYLTTWVY